MQISFDELLLNDINFNENLDYNDQQVNDYEASNEIRT